MSKKVCKLIIVFLLLVLCLDVSGCSNLASGKGNKKYLLPTSNQIDNYIKNNNITNIISVDAINNHYVNILYKIGQNGIGSKGITSIYGKVIIISDAKTIPGGKMPGVVIGGTRDDEAKFRYIYLDDSIAREAKEMKIVYYDNIKNENIEIIEKVNDKNCFIYAEPKYNNIVQGYQSISVYGENGEKLDIR